MNKPPKLKTRDSYYILDTFGKALSRVKNPKQRYKQYVTKVW